MSNKRLKYLSAIILQIIISNTLIAQITQISIDYEVRRARDFYETNKFIDRDRNYTLTENEIEGSPYLNKDFVSGTIYTIQRLQYNEIPLRYNVYNDNIEFKTPSGEIMALATPEIVEKAVLGNTTLVFLPYQSGNKIKKGFFTVIEQGKATFYSKPVIIYKPPVKPDAYRDSEPARFENRPNEYYIQTANEPAVLIGNKKDFIAAFPDNRDKVENFINKNKTKLNKPEDILEVVRFYNSL